MSNINSRLMTLESWRCFPKDRDIATQLARPVQLIVTRDGFTISKFSNLFSTTKIIEMPIATENCSSRGNGSLGNNPSLIAGTFRLFEDLFVLANFYSIGVGRCRRPNLNRGKSPLWLFSRLHVNDGLFSFQSFLQREIFGSETTRLCKE
jgi:hypothetical protein